MTEHPATTDDRLQRAVTQLVTVFEQLGAEHKALVAEAEKTIAKERRGTVHRTVECIAQASYTLSPMVNMLATVHGLKALGTDNQFSKDADGLDYSPLNSLRNPSETVCEADRRAPQRQVGRLLQHVVGRRIECCRSWTPSFSSPQAPLGPHHEEKQCHTRNCSPPRRSSPMRRSC
ncbi:hypothetical protein JK364_23105 [Streptomyces sp. 110]|uniref:Transposase n=1 Tax=Streptomyces endocoffeicus TaxID=2898945 RepID=A0ABS1PS55_9ACTN|nr:hypothetical protein [Streptomyces endocoffeicus]MBL1115263.1 hypothetical protein [Streptomyces endocoffeicus]